MCGGDPVECASAGATLHYGDDLGVESRACKVPGVRGRRLGWLGGAGWLPPSAPSEGFPLLAMLAAWGSAQLGGQCGFHVVRTAGFGCGDGDGLFWLWINLPAVGCGYLRVYWRFWCRVAVSVSKRTFAVGFECCDCVGDDVKLSGAKDRWFLLGRSPLRRPRRYDFSFAALSCCAWRGFLLPACLVRWFGDLVVGFVARMGPGVVWNFLESAADHGRRAYGTA